MYDIHIPLLQTKGLYMSASIILYNYLYVYTSASYSSITFYYRSIVQWGCALTSSKVLSQEDSRRRG